MKRTLSAVVDKMKRLLASSTSDSDEEGEQEPGPDLYECDECGVVFISCPSKCSNCGDDEFSNVGKFS